MRHRTSRLLAVLLAAGIAGCGAGADPADTPDAGADSFILYSIDVIDGPGPDAPRKPPAGGESFHGRPVLGKLEVKDPATRQELVAAFREGIARSDDGIAACFEPRHGIRTTRGGEVIDYVICFECHQYRVIGGGKSRPAKAIDGSPSKTFNAILRRANIPLAPSAHESGA